MKFYVYDKETLQPIKVYSCDPAQHGVDNGDAAAGCEHAAALLISATDRAGTFTAPDGVDFSSVAEEQVPPLSKASMLPPTDKQIEAYKAAILADAERVIAASREVSK